MSITIYDYAKMMNQRLICEYITTNHTGPWHARIPRVEVVDDGLLVGVYGVGSTPDEAIADFVKQISGKRLSLEMYDGAKFHKARVDCPELKV